MVLPRPDRACCRALHIFGVLLCESQLTSQPFIALRYACDRELSRCRSALRCGTAKQAQTVTISCRPLAPAALALPPPLAAAATCLPPPSPFRAAPLALNAQASARLPAMSATEAPAGAVRSRFGVICLTPGHKKVALVRLADTGAWQFPSLLPGREGALELEEQLETALDVAQEQLGLDITACLCSQPVIHVRRGAGAGGGVGWSGVRWGAVGWGAPLLWTGV